MECAKNAQCKIKALVADSEPIITRIIRWNWNHSNCKSNLAECLKDNMNYLDLFSGIGGFALGFERAGWKFDKHYFSEIDKYASQIYKKHFPTAVELGDVCGIKEGLGRIDLITFGFPCQDLSIAGKRAGLGGSRSGLFFEATRLIRLYKPRTFIFENVKGLFSSNGGKDFEIVLQEIADIGLYECEWQLLNTSWFLPQNRERIYFIEHLGKDGGQKVFPIGENSSRSTERSKQATVNTLTAGGHSGGMHSSMTLLELTENKSQGYRVYDPTGISTTIAGEAGGVGANTGLYAIPVLTPCIRAEHHNTADVHYIPNEMGIRRLTPTECCRLQGFPDSWVDGISDNQKYRCLGNAVTVDVVCEIAKRLFPER